MTLRLLSYNIRYGGTGREKALASVINACEPDVAILQEATNPDVVKQLASACGMKFWGANRGDSLAFLSRIEMAHHGWHYVLTGRRRYLELVPAGVNLRLFGVHLAAIHSNLTEWRRTSEIRFLLSQIAQYQNSFHLVLGDFNTLAPGEDLDLRKLPLRLRALSFILGGRIRWKTVSLMVEGGYADGYRFLHHDDAGYTFPTWDPHLRLDFLFAPVRLTGHLTRCEAVRTAPSVRDASDHFPLLAEIREPA